MTRFFGIDEDTRTESAAPTKEEPTGPETVNGVIYNTARVNVRERSSLKAKVLEILNSGDKVKILGRDNGFRKVSTPSGVTGFIVDTYVKEVK